MAPGLVMVYTLITTARTSKIGIMILETLSMPFSTPMYIMTRFSATKTQNQSYADPPLVMKSVKKVSEVIVSISVVRNANKYLQTQPPITE